MLTLGMKVKAKSGPHKGETGLVVEKFDASIVVNFEGVLFEGTEDDFEEVSDKKK